MKDNRDEKRSSTHVSWDTKERNETSCASRRMELPELNLNKSIREFYQWMEEAESYSEFMSLSMKPKKKQMKMLLKHLNPVLREMIEKSIKESDDFEDGLIKLERIFNERNPLQSKRWKHMKLRQKAGEDFFKWRERHLNSFQDAKMEEINTEEFMILSLVSKTNEGIIKKRIEMLKNPTMKDVEEIAKFELRDVEDTSEDSYNEENIRKTSRVHEVKEIEETKANTGARSKLFEKKECNK